MWPCRRFSVISAPPSSTSSGSSRPTPCCSRPCSWSGRWAFFVNIPTAVIVLLVLMWRVPESRDPEAGRRPDLAGTALVTAGLGGIVYGLIESSRLGWGNPRVITALVGGGTSLAAFIVVEGREASPMLPLPL